MSLVWIVILLARIARRLASTRPSATETRQCEIHQHLLTFEPAHNKCFGRLLKKFNRNTLEPKVALEVLRNLTNKKLKGLRAKEEVGAGAALEALDVFEPFHCKDQPSRTSTMRATYSGRSELCFRLASLGLCVYLSSSLAFCDCPLE